MTRERKTTSKQDWGTPRAFFEKLHSRIPFDVDLCACAYNAKLPDYIGPDVDSLSVDWANAIAARGWFRGYCNPPYESIGAWLSHGLEAMPHGFASTFLLPANTDTAWYHDFASAGMVDFLRGRIPFVDETPPEIEALRLRHFFLDKPTEANAARMLGRVLAADGALDIGADDWPVTLDVVAELFPRIEASDAGATGPTFPSMLVHFDRELGAGTRRRDSKTLELL